MIFSEDMASIEDGTIEAFTEIKEEEKVVESESTKKSFKTNKEYLKYQLKDP